MIDLDELDSDFRDKLVNVIRDSLAIGMALDIRVGTLNVQQQAKLWRRSRTDNEIDHGIFELEQENCPFLAEVLRRANSPAGVAVTGDMPGFTWQNFGEEVEIHSTSHSIATDLMKIAKKYDLTVGESFLGNVSLRKSPFSTPLEVYKASEIDKLMQEKWGS